MNVQLDIGLSYSGPVEGLDPMIGDICDVLVKHGFGTDESSDDAPTMSALALRERRLVTDEDVGQFMSNSYKVYLPMQEKEEENERSPSDQREASDQGSL